MKKASIISTVILVICIMACTIGGCSNKIERSNNGKGNIGDFYLEIEDYVVDTDLEGNPVLAIKYSFTNNSDEAASFYWVADDFVYQNGIALDRIYSDENVDTNIQPNVSIDIIMGYELMDDSDVDVELTDTLGEYDDKITKTLKISE